MDALDRADNGATSEHQMTDQTRAGALPLGDVVPAPSNSDDKGPGAGAYQFSADVSGMFRDGKTRPLATTKPGSSVGFGCPSWHVDYRGGTSESSLAAAGRGEWRSVMP